MTTFLKWVILIVFTYLVMHFVIVWQSSAENWNAGQPDRQYDVKMKF